MAHAVSLSYARSDHMSPVAVAMTTTLHLAVAAALYWISPLNYIDTTPDAIAVTMEREVPSPPKPEAPPPTLVPLAPPSPAATSTDAATPGGGTAGSDTSRARAARSPGSGADHAHPQPRSQGNRRRREASTVQARNTGCRDRAT